MSRPKRTKDPFRLSILDIPRADIARRLFGSATEASVKRVKRWLNGTQPLTVAHFWELYQAFPYIDMERSLEDLYDRRLRYLARYRLINEQRANAQIKDLTNTMDHDTTDADPYDEEPA